MQRFYHKLSLSLFYEKHKKLIIFGLFLLIIVVYLAPLLRYLPMAAGVTRDFVFDGKSLRQENGRTNVLILGLGGPKNEPSGLTDTILLASFDRNANKALLLSLPRDIWVPEMRAKINTAYHYGNQEEGLGIEWARRYVSEIVGEPVHYVFVISFEGFVRVIDLLGGVDVNVEKGFTDDRYPISGREADTCGGDPMTLCRWEMVSFDRGWQHLDGATALKFARSRKAESEEGSDFARANRQQKIILAVKEKVLSTDFLLSPKKVSQMLTIIGASVETDIPESHLGGFGKLVLQAKNAGMRSAVLSDIYKPGEKDGFLINPPISALYENQYVLMPRANTWQPAQEWIDCLLSGKECDPAEFTKNIRD